MAKLGNNQNLMKGADTMKDLLEKLVAAKGDEAKIREILSSINRPTGVVKDRVAWISQLQSIAEVRRALHVAHAKKSKTKKEKYQMEIEAAKKRLNELLAQAGSDPRKLLELGEEPQKVLQVYLSEVETKYKEQLDKLTGISKKQVKELLNAVPADTPDELLKEMEELGLDSRVYQDRVSRNDQRLINLNRIVALVKVLQGK